MNHQKQKNIKRRRASWFNVLQQEAQLLRSKQQRELEEED